MEFLENFARKYGGVVIAGVVGAIIRRIRENMTLIEFLQVIFLGVFVSYCVGVVVEEYFVIVVISFYFFINPRFNSIGNSRNYIFNFV